MTDHTADLEATADAILESNPTPPPSPIVSAVANGARLTSGSERGERSETVDPGQFMPKADPDAQPLMPSTGRSGASSHSRFTHSHNVSVIHDKAREAARVGSLPASHSVAPTKAMTTAWQAVQDAYSAAEAAMRVIPVKVAEAQQERSRLAGRSDEPVALPSTDDVRVHYDAVAADLCQRVVDARAEYDRVVGAEADAHTASLGESIPSLSSSVLERVRDLEQAVRDLRTGVAAYVEVAGNSSPDVMPQRLPSTTDLSGLAALEQEVEQLVEVAESPSQPRITPSLAERALIMQRARQAVGGLTPEVLELSRVEREVEGYAHTAHTKAIPDSVLASFAQSQASFLI